MPRYFKWGRVFASSPDSAAMQIRDKHPEIAGDLKILEAFRQLGWYEFVFEVEGDESE